MRELLLGRSELMLRNEGSFSFLGVMMSLYIYKEVSLFI